MCHFWLLVSICPKMSRLFIFFATILVSNPISTLAQLPNGECSAEDLVCHIQDDNLVGIVEGTANLEECLETQNEADFVTYFGPSGFPFVNSCLFFSACETLGVKFRSYHLFSLMLSSLPADVYLFPDTTCESTKTIRGAT